jgi:hypothetical protein
MTPPNDPDASPPPTPERDPRWAAPVDRLKVTEVPSGAVSLNVDGRELASPLRGFGQLWRKTFRVRLPGIELSPAEVMAIWKAEFPSFHPPESQFYPTLAGIQPGSIVLINGRVPPLPGWPKVMPVAGGVMVMYADDTSFAVVTPEGFPESGWNEFSTYLEDGVVVAQVQLTGRPADPLYEFFYRVLGSGETQDAIWTHVLASLAKRVGVNGQVQSHATCLDPRLQWKYAGGIWRNSAFWTVMSMIFMPWRWFGRGRRGG